MPGITKGFNLTGGPPSNAGQMADAGTINDTYAALRAKSSSINKIPGAQMILDAKEFAAKEDAETLRDKAEWDSKAIGAKFDYYSDKATAAGESAKAGGFLSGLAGVGMGAFNLMSGGGSGGSELGTGFTSGVMKDAVSGTGTSWGDLSNTISGFGNLWGN